MTTDIDRECATKIMGWHDDAGRWVDSDQQFKYWVDEFRPSEFITYAWLVVERMKELGYTFSIECNMAVNFNYLVLFSRILKYSNSNCWERYDAVSDSAPPAIVNAALAAIEDTDVKMP